MGNHKFEIGESFLYWNVVYTIYERYIFGNPITGVEFRYKIINSDGDIKDVLESELKMCMKVDKNYVKPKMSIDEAFQYILGAADTNVEMYGSDGLEEAISIASNCMLIPKIDDAQKLKYHEALTNLITIAEIVSSQRYGPDDIAEKILIAKECMLIPKSAL